MGQIDFRNNKHYFALFLFTIIDTMPPWQYSSSKPCLSVSLFMDENTKNEFITLFLQTSQGNVSSMKALIAKKQSDKPDPDILSVLYRLAHSLKGECSAMGFVTTAKNSHLLEVVFKKIINNELLFTPELVVDISESINQLEYSLNHIASSGSEIDLTNHISQFEQRTGIRLSDVR